MAGDWIKMRVDLGDDPAVIAIAMDLSLDEDTVVGKLHRLWSWADKHTIDGTTNGVTLAWVDRFVSAKGFADALCKHHWLAVEGNRLVFPNFDRHNGESAKRRGEATIRQRLSRKNRDAGDTGIKRVITPAPFVRAVLARDNKTCVYCGHIGDRNNKLGVDHITPQTRGGLDAIENLVTCCSLCNNEKNDRTPEEWGMPLSFLQPHVIYEGGLVTDTSQQKRDNNVTREEKRRDIKPSEPNGSLEAVWEEGISLLTSKGLADSTARSFVGMLCKRHEASDVADAFQSAAGKVDPKGYITAILKTKPLKGAPASRATFD